MSEEKRRLVTRADFDGVVCGALFNELDMIGEKDNLIIDANAPSAARVIYSHFGGKESFPITFNRRL